MKTARSKSMTTAIRRVGPPVLILLLASVVLFCRAQLVESSFEEPLTSWEGPDGGGSCGGQGGGEIINLGSNDFVRTGEHALRLKVWGSGNENSVTWAGVMKKLPCPGGRKVRIGAWLYSSSYALPLDEKTCAQLKIEYFADQDAQKLIPTHIYLSPPFAPSSYPPDRWHLLEATDRAPQDVCSLRFSIVMTAASLGKSQQAIWLDDISVEVQKSGRGRNGLPSLLRGTRPL